MARPVRREFCLGINGKICPTFLENLAKIGLLGLASNLIQMFRSERSEAQRFCVPFNNLTVLTGLAVLMESALVLMDL
jgi:hypothetical protein